MKSMAYRVYKTLRYSMLFSAFSLSVGLFCWLVLSSPYYASKPSMQCPEVLDWKRHSDFLSANQSAASRKVDCAAIFRQDVHEISYASQFKWCQRRTSMSDSAYVHFAEKCDEYKRDRGYLDHKVSKEEEEFPIAFSILTHEEAEQTERLLRAIYRPQNVYCIHVDGKATQALHKSMAAITGCFDNVLIVDDPVSVHWAEFTVLEAEMKCLELLWKHHIHWKYFINLTGREFPLKTNWELVQILKAYNGANDIDGTPHRRPIHWTRYVWRKEFWRTNQLKEDPPHNFVIAKGSTHVAATRAFIGYVLFNRTSLDLLAWMRDVRAPDEHFFQTLNHNPHMGVPGAYKGDPDLKWFYTRLKIWQDDKGVETCGGEWVRFVCNMGVADLPRLPPAKHMFVNKLRLELDPIAFQCLEQWYISRTRTEKHPDFDIEFYEKLPIVHNHL